MPRAVQVETEAINTDSFLDIVASVVSIMIIMVLMTGLKIENTPVDAAALAAAMGQTVLPSEEDAAPERSVQDEQSRAAEKIDKLRGEATDVREECNQLSQRVASLEERRRTVGQDLDRQSQEGAEVQRRIGEARSHLAELERKERAVEAAPGPTVAIESYPTPLSRDVEGHELHFHLRAGRVAFVPMDSFLEKLKGEIQLKAYRLRDEREMTETLEPEGGFLLKYALQRVDHGARSYIRLKYFTITPTSDDLGEPVERALVQDSQFSQVLRDPRAKDATITIWTYPDSFDAFRQIKKALFHLGFSVAARPLAEGQRISASPEGTKSAAE